MSALDARLLAAHAAGDHRALIILYAEAAAQSLDETAKAFYLTHAYVFALEEGVPEATKLRQQLVDMGREVPL